MKIHFLDRDERKDVDTNYHKNFGPFSQLSRRFNKELKKLDCYAEPDDADLVMISDGLEVGFRYKDKKSAVLHVWELFGSLPLHFLMVQKQTNQRILGLSNQITDLWKKASVPCSTVYGGCDTEYWKPAKPKNKTFTFTHINSSHIRSGLEISLQAFHAAFQNNGNVKLLVKDTNHSLILEERINEYKRLGTNIEYDNRRISYDEIRDLYSSSHVCLNLLRSTSFGFPLLESSACGCLCVTGDCAPTNELIHSSYGVLLKPSELVEIDRTAPYLESHWGLANHYPKLFYVEPPCFYDYDVGIYASLLNDIYDNWGSRYSKIETRQPIVDNWKWENSCKRLVEVLNSAPGEV